SASGTPGISQPFGVVSVPTRRVLVPLMPVGTVLMPDKHNNRSEAIVVGGGPAGLTAAIALAEGGIDTVLVGKKASQRDNRTTALLAGSVTALETLGIWPLCEQSAAPLKALRIVDDTGRLLRAPEVKFTSDEIDLDAFGHNIENHHLITALEQKSKA